MIERILKKVQLTRIDGVLHEVESLAVHENVVAFMQDERYCIIPLSSVGFISAERDLSEEEEEED